MEYSIPIEFMEQLETTEFEDFDGPVISVVRATQTAKKETLPDPITYLKKVMLKRGLRNKDLKVYIGSSGNVCAILKRRQALSLRMIRNLNKYLHIPAEILIQPYDCQKR